MRTRQDVSSVFGSSGAQHAVAAAEGPSTLGRCSTSRGRAALKNFGGRRAAPAVPQSTITCGPSQLNGKALDGPTETRKERMAHTTEQFRILIVDDDRIYAEPLRWQLDLDGFDVVFVSNATAALRTVRDSPPDHIHAAILDVAMPPGGEFTREATRGGFRTGLVVAQEIRKLRPALRIFGLSVSDDPEVVDWFRKYGSGFFQKPAVASRISQEILRILRGERRKPKCFIVHGHDDLAVLELKNYLQNSLGLPEPIVLRELPSSGRTVIEKLEETADDVDLAFVLLTPDDVAFPAQTSNEMRRRARQNVILEAGYFLAKLERRRGAVILLHKGAVEIPTDIAGMIYIDISGGITAAGETIRSELREWLA